MCTKRANYPDTHARIWKWTEGFQLERDVEYCGNNEPNSTGIQPRQCPSVDTPTPKVTPKRKYSENEQNTRAEIPNQAHDTDSDVHPARAATAPR